MDQYLAEGGDKSIPIAALFIGIGTTMLARCAEPNKSLFLVAAIKRLEEITTPLQRAQATPIVDGAFKRMLN